MDGWEKISSSFSKTVSSPSIRSYFPDELAFIWYTNLTHPVLPALVRTRRPRLRGESAKDMTFNLPPNFHRRGRDETDTTPNLGLLRLACLLAILAGGFLMVVYVGCRSACPSHDKVGVDFGPTCTMLDWQSRQWDRGSRRWCYLDFDFCRDAWLPSTLIALCLPS